MKKLLTLAVVIAMLALAPATAMAQEDVPGTDEPPVELDQPRTEGGVQDVIDDVKAAAAEAIGERQDHLIELTALVVDAEHLTGDHEAVLLADIDATAAGLAALGTDIQAAATLAELGDLVPRIATDYRVYLILSPKVILAIVGDTQVEAHARLSEVADEIDSAIAEVGDAGVDVSKAEELMAQARTELDGAFEDASGVAASVIDLQASDWPSARPTLEAGRDSLRRGAEHLHDAVRSGRAALQALRDAIKG